MPYKLFKKGKKFCMRALRTGKTYCYKSAVARKKGMRMHEMFAHGFRPTRRR